MLVTDKEYWLVITIHRLQYVEMSHDISSHSTEASTFSPIYKHAKHMACRGFSRKSPGVLLEQCLMKLQHFLINTPGYYMKNSGTICCHLMHVTTMAGACCMCRGQVRVCTCIIGCSLWCYLPLAVCLCYVTGIIRTAKILSIIHGMLIDDQRYLPLYKAVLLCLPDIYMMMKLFILFFILSTQSHLILCREAMWGELA